MSENNPNIPKHHDDSIDKQANKWTNLERTDWDHRAIAAKILNNIDFAKRYSALSPLIEDAPGDVNTFSLTCETPGEDDSLFQVNNSYENASIPVGDPGSIGNPAPALLTNAVLDFDIKVDYTVCVRVTDSYNKFYDKNIIVNLVRLGGGVSPSLSLSLPTTVETDAVFNNFHHHTVSATVTTDNNIGYTLSMKDNDEDYSDRKSVV